MSTPVENITVDPQPGGVFETIMVNDADGTEYPMRGIFAEVVPPERLVWTEAEVEGGMTTALTFTDLGDGTTQLVAHQTNVPEAFRTAEAQAGMQSSFDRFAVYVRALSADRRLLAQASAAPRDGLSADFSASLVVGPGTWATPTRLALPGRAVGAPDPRSGHPAPRGLTPGVASAGAGVALNLLVSTRPPRALGRGAFDGPSFADTASAATCGEGPKVQARTDRGAVLVTPARSTAALDEERGGAGRRGGPSATGPPDPGRGPGPVGCRLFRPGPEGRRRPRFSGAPSRRGCSSSSVAAREFCTATR